MQISNAGDLTQMAKDFEEVAMRHLGCTERPALAIALMLPHDPGQVHWVTNVSRDDGITLLRDTAAKMQAEIG